MKLRYTFLTLLQMFCMIITIFSCSKSEDDNSINTSLPQITTNNAESISGFSVKLGGKVINNGNSDIIKKGVCWSLSTNPTIDDNNFKEDYKNQAGIFSFNIENSLTPNTIYYARSYCQNSIGLRYGNEISFTTEKIISIFNPVDILTTNVKFKGNIIQQSNVSSIVGFVYSVNPNPTINNYKVSTSILGTAPYEIYANNLIKNTTYYVRAYKENQDGVYYYSDEKQFKTTGYYGPAGGYVAYDKGETVNGWRYLEVHPTTLNYNISYTNGVAWGPSGQFISGTFPDFGKGLENTIIIVNNVTQANCAAKLCYNLVLNGYSDWFLPSSEEMLLMSNSLFKANINIGGYTWTSSQVSADYAYSTTYENVTIGYKLFDSYPKNFGNLNVYPTRRY